MTERRFPDDEWLMIPQPNEIARGTAGDCCILCGRVGVDLPVDHGCKPNIDVAAYRAQPKRTAEFLDGRWTP